jgi:hypothetical protein
MGVTVVMPVVVVVVMRVSVVVVMRVSVVVRVCVVMPVFVRPSVEPLGFTRVGGGRSQGHRSGSRQFVGERSPGQSGAQVLDMRNGLVKQFADVVVVEVVNDASTVPMADDQPEVPQEAKLVRDG